VKNIHFERRREAAKRYKKKTSNSFTRRIVDGVCIYHCYDDPKPLSWDDFAFVLGSQRIIVTWIHPRMAYMDMVEDLAFDICGSAPKWEMFNSKGVTFRRVGKSRKKVAAYHCSPTPEASKAYYEKVRAENERLLVESSFVAKPSIRIEQWPTGRHVAITYPVELRNETDIITFAAKLKQHLLGRDDMFSHLGDYGYTAADWQAEQVTE